LAVKPVKSTPATAVPPNVNGIVTSAAERADSVTVMLNGPAVSSSDSAATANDTRGGEPNSKIVPVAELSEIDTTSELFVMTDTSLEPESATARSSRPSRLKSPTTTLAGVVPV